MPLTHDYERFIAGPRFGLVYSGGAGATTNLVVSAAAGTVVTAAGADALLWKLRTGECVRRFSDAERLQETGSSVAAADVTRLSRHGDVLAVGYADGWLRLFNLESGELLFRVAGHKARVTCLAWDVDGGRVAAGALDADVTLLHIEDGRGQRLRGHTGGISQVAFLSQQWLLSGGRDALIKVWDVSAAGAGVCCRTLTGHTAEIWDFVLLKEPALGHRLVTGSADNLLRVWRVLTPMERAQLQQGAEPQPPDSKRLATEEAELLQQEEESLEEAQAPSFESEGTLARAGMGRVHSMVLDAQGAYLALTNNRREVELFRVLNGAERKRRLRQKRKKAVAQRDAAAAPAEQLELQLGDEIRAASHVTSFRAKVAACALLPGGGAGAVQLLCGQADNSLELLQLGAPKDVGSVRLGAASRLASLGQAGHRGAVRCVAISSDNLGLLTCADGEAKVWRQLFPEDSQLAPVDAAEADEGRMHCVATLRWPGPDSADAAGQRAARDMARCCLFLPGDRHAVLGMSSGALLLASLASLAVTSVEPAHAAAVSALHLAGGTLLSASADRTARFWTLATRGDALHCELARELQLPDAITAAVLSRDRRLLCAALLDTTVRVVFADSLKPFLHLHGHSQPARCLDIAEDGGILATGSGDRTVRLWGLQFGELRRTLRAHLGAVTAVRFVRNTAGGAGGGEDKKAAPRLLFTAGEDGFVKQWDAENGQRILTLAGHGAPVHCLAAASSGNYVLSGARDASLRVWLRDPEQLVVLEDERRAESAAELDAETLAELHQDNESAAEKQLAQRVTLAALRGAERLLQALDVCEEEEAKQLEATKRNLPTPTPHPLLQALFNDLSGSVALCPRKGFILALRKLRLEELEPCLMALPLSSAERLLERLADALERDWEPERCGRCLLLLLSLHRTTFTAAGLRLAPVLQRARDALSHEVTAKGGCGPRHQAEVVGFNIAALDFLGGFMKERSAVQLFQEAAPSRTKRQLRAAQGKQSRHV